MSECLSDDLLAAFVAGEASPAELAVIDEHLAECATCASVCQAASPRAASRDLARSPTRLDASTLAWTAPIARGASIGRFLVIDELGRGGMGVVYAVYDPQLDRRVALKFLAPTLDPSRLLREARAIARLAHPNVVAVHEVGEHAGTPYVAMELVHGETLDRWLARPHAWTEILPVFLQAGAGLVAAHAAGIVHRDFKPSNVLVGDDGRVRVSDFGLARLGAVGDASSASGHATDAVHGGTPAYMAPEQRAGSDGVDARADQYSFALALHEALLGVRPSGTELRAQPDARELPAEIRAAIERGLAHVPEERFPSMTALLDVLRAHDPSDPRTAGDAALVRARRWRRFGWLALLGTITLVAAAAVVSTLVVRGQRDAARAAETRAREAERLAEQRYDRELELVARGAYARGDLRTALEYTARVMSRGADTRSLRMIAGSVAWTWPLEGARFASVHALTVSADRTRALVELADRALVVDGAGAIVATLPALGDTRGVDIDEHGRAIVVLEAADPPVLRRIPVDAPSASRVLATGPAGARWILPRFVDDATIAVRSDDDVLVVTDAGSPARTIAGTSHAIARLPVSRQLALFEPERTTLVSLLDGTQRAWPHAATAATERVDGTIALAERERVVLLDRTLRPTLAIPMTGAVHRMVFADDGALLGIATDDDLLVVDTTTGQRRARIPLHRDAPFAFAFGSVWTTADGVVQRWTLEGALHATLLAPSRAVDELWATPSGLALLAGSTLAFVAAPPERAEVFADCRAHHVWTSSDAAAPALVHCTDGTVRTWPRAPSPAMTWTRDASTPEWVFADPAGRYAAVLGYEEVRIASATGVRASPLAIESLQHLAATPGALIVSGLGGVRRLDIATLAWTDVGVRGEVTDLAWLGGTDRALAVIDNGQLVELGGTSTPRALPALTTEIATSADGAVLVARGLDDALTVLDARTLQPLAPAPLQLGALRSFALDRTGGLVAATTLDDRLVLADARSGESLVEWTFGHASPHDAAFTADARDLVLALDGVPTRLPLPLDERPRAELAHELACRYLAPCAAPPTPSGPSATTGR